MPQRSNPLYRAGRLQLTEIRLRDLITQGSGKNKHVELVGFYFGKQYIYAAKMVQVRDVYVPVFPNGESENASNLQILLWIRNDRISQQKRKRVEPSFGSMKMFGMLKKVKLRGIEKAGWPLTTSTDCAT